MDPTTSSAVRTPGSRAIGSSAGKQRRLRGRTVVAPTLDLSEVSMHAVLDRVALEVRVPRPTQFPHLQKTIADRIHYKPHVEAIGAGPGGSAQLFRVMLQDPNCDRLLGAEAAIHERYGEKAAVSVAMLEVALDARPRSNHGPSLAQLIRHLHQHFLPQLEIIQAEGGRPRQAYSRGWGKTRILGHKGGYEAALFDRGTTYYGPKGAPVAWRTYLKSHDSLRDGIGQALPADRHSARHEVTLQGGALAELGITSLETLTAFRFEQLKPFFRFFLATRPQSTQSGGRSVLASGEAWRSRYRQRLASDCGVWAVLEVDRVSDEHRQRIRSGMHRKDRAWTRFRQLAANGHLKAYDAMNERTRDALRRCKL